MVSELHSGWRSLGSLCCVLQQENYSHKFSTHMYKWDPAQRYSNVTGCFGSKGPIELTADFGLIIIISIG